MDNLTKLSPPARKLHSLKTSPREVKTFTRSSTIQSSQSQSSLLLSKNFFPDWLYDRPDFQNLFKNSDFDTNFLIKSCTKPYLFRDSLEQESIIDWLKSCPFSKTFMRPTLNEISKKIYIANFAKGEKIFIEGDEACEMFLIIRGKVEICKRNVKTSSVGEKNSVGDIALESGKVRNATVVALTAVTAMGIKSEHFQESLAEQKYQERKEIAVFLKKLPFFQNLLYTKIEYLAANTIQLFYGLNQPIYEESQDPSHFFVLKEGEIQIQKMLTLTKKNKLPTGDVLVNKKKFAYCLSTVQPNEVFGCEEIIRKCQRVSGAVSKSSNTIVYSINASLLYEVFSRKSIDSMRVQIESQAASSELKKKLNKKLSERLKRIKTVINIIEPGHNSDRKEKKNRTWLEGVMGELNRFMSKHLISEKNEFISKGD